MKRTFGFDELTTGGFSAADREAEMERRSDREMGRRRDRETGNAWNGKRFMGGVIGVGPLIRSAELTGEALSSQDAPW